MKLLKMRGELACKKDKLSAHFYHIGINLI